MLPAGAGGRGLHRCSPRVTALPSAAAEHSGGRRRRIRRAAPGRDRLRRDRRRSGRGCLRPAGGRRTRAPSRCPGRMRAVPNARQRRSRPGGRRVGRSDARRGASSSEVRAPGGRERSGRRVERRGSWGAARRRGGRGARRRHCPRRWRWGGRGSGRGHRAVARTGRRGAPRGAGRGHAAGRGCRSGPVRSGAGTGAGRAGASLGGAAGGGRQHRQRVEVGVARAGFAYAEVEVRLVGRARARGADRAQALAGRRRAAPARTASEERCRYEVSKPSPVRTLTVSPEEPAVPAKRTSPAAAATTGVPDRRRYVDAAVLSARVGVGPVAVRSDDLASDAASSSDGLCGSGRGASKGGEV